MALQVCAMLSINPQQFEQDVYVMFSTPVWSLCRAKRAWTGKQWETNSCLPKRDVLTWGCLSSVDHYDKKKGVHACKVIIHNILFLTQQPQNKQPCIMFPSILNSLYKLNKVSKYLMLHFYMITLTLLADFLLRCSKVTETIQRKNLILRT